MVMKRIYLDHTATTPLDSRVLGAMMPYFSDIFGNASSVHRFGQEAKSALERSRETIAAAIGAEPGELFFTSGGTESDNFAITGVLHAGRKKGRNHIVTSQVEHHAVLDTCHSLEEEGASVTYIPVDQHGWVSDKLVGEALTEATCLVSVMHANNEVGTINPIAGIVGAVHGRGTLVHTDAVQSLGKVPLSAQELGVDLMTISAHKLYGPKGIGALYVRKGTDIDPLFHGGGQERGKRPGTENVPLAVGFAKAVELVMDDMNVEVERLSGLRNLLESKIRDRFPAAIINGHPHHRLPHILNMSFDSGKVFLEGEMLLMNMDLQGIAVTSGSACTSGSMQPSHVLLAMGRDARTAKATLRFAFGRANSADDVDVVVETLHGILQQMTAER
jgi:cysteine desulfurase